MNAAAGHSGHTLSRLPYEGYASTWDETVEASRVRASGSGVRARAAHAPSASGPDGRVVTGRYECAYYRRGQGLVHSGAFTIAAGGRYLYLHGRWGTYTFDAATATVTFHGGASDGQRAEYSTDGRPARHILNHRGRRVVDCDGPR